MLSCWSLLTLIYPYKEKLKTMQGNAVHVMVNSDQWRWIQMFLMVEENIMLYWQHSAARYSGLHTVHNAAVDVTTKSLNCFVSIGTSEQHSLMAQASLLFCTYSTSQNKNCPEPFRSIWYIVLNTVLLSCVKWRDRNCLLCFLMASFSADKRGFYVKSIWISSFKGEPEERTSPRDLLSSLEVDCRFEILLEPKSPTPRTIMRIFRSVDNRLNPNPGFLTCLRTTSWSPLKTVSSKHFKNYFWEAVE